VNQTEREKEGGEQGRDLYMQFTLSVCLSSERKAQHKRLHAHTQSTPERLNKKGTTAQDNKGKKERKEDKW